MLSDELWSCVESCKIAAEFYVSMEKDMFDCGLIGPDNTTLPALEKSLLDMAASNVTEGILYCFVVKWHDFVIVRYIESGCYRGYVRSCYLQHLNEGYSLNLTEFCAMKLYTDYDISARSMKLSDRRHSLSSIVNRSKCNIVYYFM
jgi:hypothetical protein